MKRGFPAIDYTALDGPEVSGALFYPRIESVASHQQGKGENVLIPVEGNVLVGGRFHLRDVHAPSILFFHGNGEIVADYDDIAQLYLDVGINFFPVDYRGYGRSTGRPTVTAMMRDAHVVYHYVRRWQDEHGGRGALIVMGRSLGSAPALELADSYTGEIDGLIVESGFADAQPLLTLLGVSLEYLGITEEEGFGNRGKMSRFPKPTLVIHGEYDNIIPCEEGNRLFASCPSSIKRLLVIPGAGHNDLFSHGITEYLDAVTWIAAQVRHPAG